MFKENDSHKANLNVPELRTEIHAHNVIYQDIYLYTGFCKQVKKEQYRHQVHSTTCSYTIVMCLVQFYHESCTGYVLGVDCDLISPGRSLIIIIGPLNSSYLLNG